MCACGGGSDNPTNGGDAANDGAAAAAKGYLTYEDLTRTESLTVWPDDGEYFSYEIDCPDTRFDSSGWGIFSENALEYSIVVSHSERPLINSGASLEEAFEEVLNGESAYRSTLRSFETATYDEIAAETESVMLDCGKEAIKFSGIIHEDDYGTLSDCPVYGYCVSVGGAPVIVSYVLFDADELGDDTISELQKYVDEMVNTIRISGE